MSKRILVSILAVAMLLALIPAGCATSKPEQKTAIDTILNSFSTEEFAAGKITDESIQQILQCGQKATSSWNLQPWHFTVIRNSDTIKNLLANGVAQREYQDGNTIIVISAKIKEDPGVSTTLDAALAAQNMYIAAQSLGLGTRFYYDVIPLINSSLKDTLGIPQDYEAQIYLYLGYLPKGVDVTTSASERNPLEGNVNYID